jgi:hypothetical protein
MSTMLEIVIGTVTVASSHQPLASQIGGKPLICDFRLLFIFVLADYDFIN